jgi:hypothetical protein
MFKDPPTIHRYYLVLYETVHAERGRRIVAIPDSELSGTADDSKGGKSNKMNQQDLLESSLGFSD